MDAPHTDPPASASEPALSTLVVNTARLPVPADGLGALVNLLAQVEQRGGPALAAVQSLLAGLHRSFALLTPGYPTAAAPAGLWGFSPAPAASLDELDAQINRLEDVLLQLLPAYDEEWTQE
jgi:hypothetical protein